MEKKIVFVEKHECTSCNQCADNLPVYFQMDEDDLSESHNNGNNLNDAQIPENDWDKVQNEIDECPGECIHWKN